MIDRTKIYTLEITSKDKNHNRNIGDLVETYKDSDYIAGITIYVVKNEVDMDFQSYYTLDNCKIVSATDKETEEATNKIEELKKDITKLENLIKIHSTKGAKELNILLESGVGFYYEEDEWDVLAQYKYPKGMTIKDLSECYIKVSDLMNAEGLLNENKNKTST